MSQENVEVARRAYEAWNVGDVDALRETHDPDVIARYPEDWPESGPFVGREAVVRQLALSIRRGRPWRGIALRPSPPG